MTHIVFYYPDYLEIVLTHDISFYVSPQDENLIFKYTWKISKKGYLITTVKNKTLTLHRMIAESMNIDLSEEIDHIDCNKLNNCRDNLRSATAYQNAQNVSVKSNNTSGYKGIDWDKKRLKWRSRIRVKGERVHLGYFDTPELAAQAYNDAALLYFGEFAKLNII